MNFDQLVEKLESIDLGTPIPKPKSNESSRFAGWGIRRSERAFVYSMPNHTKPSKPHKKGITLGELQKAFDHLNESGSFTRQWFKTNMTACDKEGSCNFTTIGGIFTLIGIAYYSGNGNYHISL